jgi:hypothetical protein
MLEAFDICLAGEKEVEMQIISAWGLVLRHFVVVN